MGKAVAEKFAGKWKQESTDNIDAVNFFLQKSFYYFFKLNTKLGFGWATRKIANMMDVHIEITCNADVCLFMKAKIIFILHLEHPFFNQDKAQVN